ncbi:hypothetical protein [Actinopolymorpha rutila]|uniref:Uncharacterized protein n=1 Tax=Actinopolymorpha rutila TaxID=446787 RepID=A0A852ZVV2_9ACTN|nr:hypothetical protein [Actinopolymorpha rutila]NYH92826.1 hypothetical protein [Actinopolymorpha rutila]
MRAETDLSRSALVPVLLCVVAVGNAVVWWTVTTYPRAMARFEEEPVPPLTPADLLVLGIAGLLSLLMAAGAIASLISRTADRGRWIGALSRAGLIACPLAGVFYVSYVGYLWLLA